MLYLAKNLGVEKQFHLLGFRSDVPALAQSADILCFPSHREGLGLSALEAMACGLPLVTSNVHGINDYSENGVTGYKCPPNDKKAWIECLSVLINDSSKCMEYGNNNKDIVKRYSNEKILKKMDEIYNSRL